MSKSNDLEFKISETNLLSLILCHSDAYRANFVNTLSQAFSSVLVKYASSEYFVIKFDPDGTKDDPKLLWSASSLTVYWSPQCFGRKYLA